MKIKINENVKGLRAHQHAFFKVCRKARYVAYLLPRQHGKTWLVGRILVDFLFRYSRKDVEVLQALVVCSTVGQAFTVHFKQIEDVLLKLPQSLVKITRGGSGARTHVEFKRPWFGDKVFLQFIGGGNLDALRGETADFIILDETADIKRDSWSDILEPMLDDTNGRAIITGTAKGEDSEFYSIFQSFKAQSADKPHRYATFEMDMFTARLRNEQFITDKVDAARVSGKMNSLLQEYMNRWDAKTQRGEFPYRQIAQKLRRHCDVRYQHDASHLFASFDLGKRGNNAMWVWRYVGGGDIHLIEYTDELGHKEAIDYLVRAYPEASISVIYPHDGALAGYKEETSLFDDITAYIEANGYKKRIKLEEPLPKPQNKLDLIDRSVVLLNGGVFIDLKKTAAGLAKLEKVRHKKDKEGNLDFSKFARSRPGKGGEHCADCITYIAGYLSMGRAQSALNLAKLERGGGVLSYNAIGGSMNQGDPNFNRANNSGWNHGYGKRIK